LDYIDTSLAINVKEGARMSKHKKIERKKELDRRRKRRKERIKLRAKGLLPPVKEKKT
jgi:hypothetical protein